MRQMIENAVYNFRCWLGGKVMFLGHRMLPKYVRMCNSATFFVGLKWARENQDALQAEIDKMKEADAQ